MSLSQLKCYLIIARLNFRCSLVSGLPSGSFPEQRLVIEPKLLQAVAKEDMIKKIYFLLHISACIPWNLASQPFFLSLGIFLQQTQSLTAQLGLTV